MWEHTVRMPGRWLNRQEALDYLGISEAKFELLLSARIIPTHGKGNGQRYDAAAVHAAGVLWRRLDELLAPESE